MDVQWTPLANYAGANHVLGAGACCIHPKNGNQYFWDCVQWSGARQNLNIYRVVAKTDTWEHVVTFEGTKDAERGFERGQCFIGQGGALIVATTMTPKDVPYVTTTGFQGVRCRIPGIDEPWSMAGAADPALAAEVAELRKLADHFEYLIALQQHKIDTQAQSIAAIETILGTLEVGGGLSAPDAELLRRLRAFLLPLLGP